MPAFREALFHTRIQLKQKPWWRRRNFQVLQGCLLANLDNQFRRPLLRSSEKRTPAVYTPMPYLQQSCLADRVLDLVIPPKPKHLTRVKKKSHLKESRTYMSSG